jgi:hypothetical protein
MKPDEILKAAQESSDGIGEREKQVSTKAILYGLMVGIVFLIFMTLIELFVLKKIDMGKFALVFIISGIIDLYEGVVCKKKATMVAGIIMLILALIFFIAYLGVMFS